MEDLLKKSKEVMDRAVAEYDPYAAVVMFSGGDDSRTAYHVLKAIGYNPDAIIHGITGTGIKQCTEYCRRFADNQGERFIVAQAGNKYNWRTIEKGWPGPSRRGHSFAYHLCKAGPFRHAISRHFRKRKWGRNVLMIAGPREDESDNRKQNYSDDYFNADPAAKRNIWVNLIWDWKKKDCMDFLREQGSQRNPVTALLHRSGECMCGTMQSKQEGEEAAYWFPEWAENWWYPMRKRVWENGHHWDWGEHPNDRRTEEEPLPPFADFQPACRTCIARRQNALEEVDLEE